MNGLELNIKTNIEKEKVEEIVNEKKVTEEKIEESLNYDSLTQEEKDAILEFNEKLDITDTTQILQYGVPAQEKISKFSDSMICPQKQLI